MREVVFIALLTALMVATANAQPGQDPPVESVPPASEPSSVGDVEQEPVADAPAAEAPDAKAPDAEAPDAEEATADAPVVEVPVADAPVVEVPVAGAPVVEVPVADVPQQPAVGKPHRIERLAGFSLSGFGQVDYLRRQISLDELDDGSREPLNEDRFLVRRARFILDREWRHVGVSTMVELFGDGGTVRPVAYELHAQIPSRSGDAPPIAKARAGLFAVPFGFESYGQSDTERFFGERSLFAYGFVPGRFDLGAAVSGSLWSVDWIVAIQNGEPLESGAFSYEDPNAAKDVSARVGTRGALIGGVRAAAAFSLLNGRGFSPGTPPTKDTFEWRDLNEDGRVIPSELIAIPGSAGRPSQDFRRWGIGGDVQLWRDIAPLGELMVYGEAAVASNLDRAVAPADPVLFGRDQRSFGVYIAATQELTEHAKIGARFEHYEPNADALELFDGITVVTRRRFRTLTLAAAGLHRLSPSARAKLLVEYEIQRNSLGRDNQGRPAQLDNNTFRIRAEVAFD